MKGTTSQMTANENKPDRPNPKPDVPEPQPAPKPRPLDEPLLPGTPVGPGKGGGG